MADDQATTSPSPPDAKVGPTAEAISTALSAADDFGHELRVKEALRRNRWMVKHGWTYLDPVEGKPRQFDLRARYADAERTHFLEMAIECKNIAIESPLIISGVPRQPNEAFHDFVVSGHRNDSTAAHVRRAARESFYPSGKFVGKSILRLKPGKGEDAGRLVSSSPLESEIYNRWSQALASADELCKQASDQSDQDRIARRTFILPAVVVPDRTLWVAEYASNGALKSPPAVVNSTTFFVNHEVIVVPKNNWMNLTHIHFFTLTGLGEFLDSIQGWAAPWEEWFPASAENHHPPIH